MSVRISQMRAALGELSILALVLFSGCSGNDHPNVLLGSYQFVGQAQIGSCSENRPAKDWTTTFMVSASSEVDRLWMTESTYGCRVLAPLRESIVDASGLSCPVSGAGYFEENFIQFRWDFTSKILAFDATLYGQDVNNAVLADCAGVYGSTTLLQ